MEGEHELAAKNHELGQFYVNGIPKNKAGEEKIEETFSIDNNAMLTVTAKICSTGKEADMTINYNKSRLSSDDVNRMLKDLSLS